MLLVWTVLISAHAATAVGVDPIAPTVGLRLGDGIRFDARAGPILSISRNRFVNESDVGGTNTDNTRLFAWGGRLLLDLRIPLLRPDEGSSPRLDLIGGCGASYTSSTDTRESVEEEPTRTRNADVSPEAGLGAELPLDARQRWTVGLDGLLSFYEYDWRRVEYTTSFVGSSQSTTTSSSVRMGGWLRLLFHVRL